MNRYAVGVEYKRSDAIGKTSVSSSRLRTLPLLADLGFLAESPEEYAGHFQFIFEHCDDFAGLRQRARTSVERFSDERFDEAVRNGLRPFFLDESHRS